jgi:hypothetical protein
MIFMMLKGADAKACSIRLYYAGLFNFPYPPRDLSVIFPNWVIVMSRVNPGPLTPKEHDAFRFVIETIGDTYPDVLVRDDPGNHWREGTVVVPPLDTTPGAGIKKYLSGGRPNDCAATLASAYLISNCTPNPKGYVEITSNLDLDKANADQSGNFDSVIRAVADKFDHAQVSDTPPP